MYSFLSSFNISCFNTLLAPRFVKYAAVSYVLAVVFTLKEFVSISIPASIIVATVGRTFLFKYFKYPDTISIVLDIFELI